MHMQIIKQIVTTSVHEQSMNHISLQLWQAKMLYHASPYTLQYIPDPIIPTSSIKL